MIKLTIFPIKLIFLLDLAGTSVEHVEQLRVQQTALGSNMSVSHLTSVSRPHLDELGLTEAAVSVLVESLEYLDGSLPPLLLCVALTEQF